jgi:hypothetical protein
MQTTEATMTLDETQKNADPIATPVGFNSPPEHGAGPRDMVSPVPWLDLEKWDLARKQVLFRGKNCDDPFSDKPKSS